MLPPVLVLSTGRCGSTMVSEVLNTHPAVLSLSEFFISLGMKALIRKRLGGKALWGICCRHSPGLKAMLAGDRDRILYPFDTPQARYSHSRHTVDPVRGPAPSDVRLRSPARRTRTRRARAAPGVPVRPVPVPVRLAVQAPGGPPCLGRTVGRLAAVRSAAHGAFSAGAGGPYPPRRQGHGPVDEQASRLQGRAGAHAAVAAHGRGPVRRRPDSQYQPAHPAAVSLCQHAEDDAPGGPPSRPTATCGAA